MDIALAFNAERLNFDLSLADKAAEAMEKDLRGDDGLLTAVIISLFTDARAQDGDRLPDERDPDRRGWWGDGLEAEEDAIGSRLWLLAREKEQAVVVARAEQYAQESLAWLVKKGFVRELRVKASHVGRGHLGIAVEFLPADSAGPGREWNFLYDYANAGLSPAPHWGQTAPDPV